MFIFASLNNVLETGIEDALEVSAAWDNNWELVFGGGSAGGTGLFGAINSLGLLFAVGALLVSAVGLWRAYSQQRSLDIGMFMWVILAIVLFANGGQLLAASILALRSIVNQVAEQVIASTLAGIRIDEVMQDLQGRQTVQEILENAYRACLPLSGQEQVDCLENAASAADGLSSLFGGSSWFSGLVDLFRDAGNALSAGDSFSLVGLISPIWKPILYSILYWSMQAFQHLLEAVMLLTGLMAPLAVGGSMFFFGVNSLVAWLTGFFTVGIAKVSFNVIVGLAAVTVTNSGVNDPGWFPLFVGLFAPLMSFAIASGSGYAVWNAFTSVGSLGLRFVGGAVGGPVGATAATVATSRS